MSGIEQPLIAVDVPLGAQFLSLVLVEVTQRNVHTDAGIGIDGRVFLRVLPQLREWDRQKSHHVGQGQVVDVPKQKGDPFAAFCNWCGGMHFHSKNLLP